MIKMVFRYLLLKLNFVLKKHGECPKGSILPLRSQWGKPVRHFQRLSRIHFILGMLLILLSVNLQPGWAQVSFGRLKITNVITNNFPEIKVQAIVRDEKGGVIPLPDISNLELLENQQSMEYTVETVEGPIEVMLVLDLGPNLDRDGAVILQGEDTANRYLTRSEEMFDIAAAFIDSMRAGDSVGIITVAPFQQPQVNTLQSLTTDQDLLRNQLASLTYVPSNQASKAVQALDEAINALQNSQVQGQNVIQAIVLISDGYVHNFASPTYSAVLERARQLGIPIHTVLTHQYDVSWTSAKLKEIARLTYGKYVFYQRSSDREIIPQWANEQRVQYLFTYRSPFGGSENRRVELRTKGGGTGQKSSTASYQVKLAPPEIRIQEPVDGLTISRTYPEGGTIADATPKSATVVTTIRWPDGFQRVISRAKLVITGASNQEVILPFPAGDSFRFTYDLTPFTQEGKSELQMWVEVTDELVDAITEKPFVYVSPTQKLYVEVIPPVIKQTVTPPPSPPPACADLNGLNSVLCYAQQYAWLLSLSLSFLALMLVVVFRSRIAGVAVQVGDAVRETVARITRPQKTEVGAYLQVLRGADDLPRNRFPLYLNTVTPIGRDKRQADLIFDENAAQSVVSRLHCEIIEEGGVYTIRDKGSTHGTYVNGKRLPELGSQQLQDGDQIEIGPVERGGILLRFELATEEPMQQIPQEDDIADRETRPML